MDADDLVTQGAMASGMRLSEFDQNIFDYKQEG